MLTIFELHSILKERQHGWKGQVISSVLTTFLMEIANEII